MSYCYTQEELRLRQQRTRSQPRKQLKLPHCPLNDPNSTKKAKEPDEETISQEFEFNKKRHEFLMSRRPGDKSKVQLPPSPYKKKNFIVRGFQKLVKKVPSDSAEGQAEEKAETDVKPKEEEEDQPCSSKHATTKAATVSKPKKKKTSKAATSSTTKMHTKSTSIFVETEQA